MAINVGSSNKLHLEAIDRIGCIPLVETSFKCAEQIYGRIKTNNRLFNWYFETAEATLYAAYDTVQPTIKLLEAPLKHLDGVVCKSLDILEQRIPLIYLPPEMMYWNTKEYMSDHLVRPVIKRADSVKQIGNAVLESQLTTYAADRIDGAFTVADKYVDKYLVPIEGDTGSDQVDAKCDEEANKMAKGEKGAIKAIHHGQRFSRKLKRRLTQRTLAEARALKKQSKEAIHIIIYAAELIATDPKLALQKARELWAYLSQDEPENQARPATLEQLIVLLTRESVRRVVHLVNFSTNIAANLPKNISHKSSILIHQLILLNEQLIKLTKLDKIKNISQEEAQSLAKRMLKFYGNMQNLTSSYLERLAIFLSGRIEAEKVSDRTSVTSAPAVRRRARTTGNILPTTAHNNINGVY